MYQRHVKEKMFAASNKITKCHPPFKQRRRVAFYFIFYTLNSLMVKHFFLVHIRTRCHDLR